MNILLTSVGRRNYIIDYFKTALNSDGLVHAANSTPSPALYAADKYIITPIIYDSNYIQFLLHYVKSNNISVLISLFDIDLPVLAQSKELFRQNGVEVIVSDFEITQICNDKWQTFRFLKKNGFNTPNTYLTLTDINFENADLYPLIVKPRWGMGSIGIFRADNKEELELFYNKVKKQIVNSYLKFESEVDFQNSVIIQEYINGQEYGLDIFNDLKGNYVQTFVKKKLAMRSGETDQAVTEDNEQLRIVGENLGKSLGHIANLDVDCFLADGIEAPYVLEMNCRFGGGYPFSHLAGVNLPKVIMDLVRNNKIDPIDLELRFNVEMMKNIQPIIVTRNG